MPAGRAHNLVFSESSYLDLANASYSWQAATVIDVCSSSSTVFVGLSMTDPNIRTWLAWLHAARVDELASRGVASAGPSTSHYWLRPHAPSAAEDRWIESSVSHLA